MLSIFVGHVGTPRSFRLFVLALTFLAPSTGLCTAAEKGDPQLERGKYLVHHVAMCIECHTPRDGTGNLRMQQALSGAAMPVRSPYSTQTWGFFAPKLRGLPVRWGQKEFQTFLQTGVTPNGNKPRPPMPPFRMSAEDAEAITVYLDSLGE